MILQILFYITLLTSSVDHSITEQELIINTITRSELQEALCREDIQLIDVRSTLEYQEGAIDRAVHIPIKNRPLFLEKITSLHKDRPVYIYCYSGVRSTSAARLLMKEGFKKLYNYKGGYKEWSQFLDD